MFLLKAFLLCLLIDSGLSHVLSVYLLNAKPELYNSSSAESCNTEIVEQPVSSPNVTLGSNINISVTVTSCEGVAIFLRNVSSGGPYIEPTNQYDLNTTEKGERSNYTRGVYSLHNVSLEENGDSMQFVIINNKGDTLYSDIFTLRVQGPPGPVTELRCQFINKDKLQIKYTAPKTLRGVLTQYSIDSKGLSPIFTTDDTVTNVTLTNYTDLDMFRAYNITVTSFNSGSIGTSSYCIVYVPNVTQIASSEVKLSLSNNGSDANLSITTQLLNTTDHPLCPACYPTLIEGYIQDINTGIIIPFELSVPVGGRWLTISRNMSMEKNVHFTAFIFYCNLAGCVNGTPNRSFSSFDLQAVSLKYNHAIGNICITCTFITGSLATGCVVKISSSTDVQTVLHSNKRGLNLIANECFKVSAHNSSYWEAFATTGSDTHLSIRPAVTGILIYKDQTSYKSSTTQTHETVSPTPAAEVDKHVPTVVLALLTALIIIVVAVVVGLLIAAVVYSHGRRQYHAQQFLPAVQLSRIYEQFPYLTTDDKENTDEGHPVPEPVTDSTKGPLSVPRALSKRPSSLSLPGRSGTRSFAYSPLPTSQSPYYSDSPPVSPVVLTPVDSVSEQFQPVVIEPTLSLPVSLYRLHPSPLPPHAVNPVSHEQVPTTSDVPINET